MKLKLLLCLLPVLVSCGQSKQADEQAAEEAAATAANLPEAIKPLAWLATADSDKDAQKAIAAKDYRLMAISGRGLMIPGIAADVAEKAKASCGIQYMDGMGDVIQGPEHKKWYQKGKDYAKAYNAIVAKQCM